MYLIHVPPDGCFYYCEYCDRIGARPRKDERRTPP